MSQLWQRVSQLRPKTIWKAGVALFIISFFVPHWRGDDDFALFGGARIFISAPFLALEFLSHFSDRDADRMQDLFDAAIIMIAWTANIPIFFRLPKLAAVIAIAVPWIAYACLFSFLVSFLPFYPWAVGIAFIHVSRMLKPEQNQIGACEPFSETRQP